MLASEGVRLDASRLLLRTLPEARQKAALLGR
jgi:hypothetical protein